MEKYVPDEPIEFQFKARVEPDFLKDEDREFFAWCGTSDKTFLQKAIAWFQLSRQKKIVWQKDTRPDWDGYWLAFADSELVMRYRKTKINWK